MTDQVTAPAEEQPVSIHALAQLIEGLRDRAIAEDTTLGQVVELTDLKRTLDAELKRVKDELKPLEEAMLDEFAERGESSARHAATGKLVYIRRQIWARAAEDKAAACAALRAAGLDEFVAESFNTQSLSAYFRELAKNELEAKGIPTTQEALEQLLDEPLRDAIALTQDNQIGVRS